MPRPLRDYLGAGLEQLDWKSRPGLDEAELMPEAGGFRTRLMRITAGAGMPVHTHAGTELTLVGRATLRSSPTVWTPTIHEIWVPAAPAAEGIPDVE